MMADEVLEKVQAMLPGAEVLRNAAGSITLGLPKGLTHLIPGFFKQLDSGSIPVLEYGIQNTTLEEVFLRLAAQNKEVNAGAVGENSETGGGLTIHPMGEPFTLTTEDGESVIVDPVGLYTSFGQCVEFDQSLYTLEGLPMVSDPAVSQGPDNASLGALEVQQQPSDQSAGDDPSMPNESQGAGGQREHLSGDQPEPVNPGSHTVQLPMSEARHLSEAERPKITAASQIRGLMHKSLYLQLGQRKANICRFVLLILCTAIAALVAVLVPDGGDDFCGSFWGRRCCPNGLAFDDSSSSRPTSNSTKDLCSLRGLQDYMSTLSTHNTHPTTAPFCVNTSYAAVEAGLCALRQEPSAPSSDPSYRASQGMFFSSMSDTEYDRPSSSQSMDAILISQGWFQDPASGQGSFSELDVLGLGAGVLAATGGRPWETEDLVPSSSAPSRTSPAELAARNITRAPTATPTWPTPSPTTHQWNGNPSTIKFVAQSAEGGGLDAKVLASQQTLRAAETPVSQWGCKFDDKDWQNPWTSTVRRGMYFANATEARLAHAALYPDFGVEISHLNIAAKSLKFSLYMYLQRNGFYKSYEGSKGPLPGTSCHVMSCHSPLP